jgi:glycosyltransferase involved in cell wall biosynthesis
MQSRPRVSVVLPVFNGQDTLGRALASIRDQTLIEHETLVIANGCTDQSVAVAQDFASSDERVRLEQLPRAGLVPALNHGLAIAQGEVIARLDADDAMMPARLEKQWEALQRNPSWSVVACGVRHEAQHEAAGEGMRRHVEWLNGLRTPAEIRQARFIDAPVAHPSVAFRKQGIVGMGGYLDGDFPEDYDLWLRCLQAGMIIGKVEDVLVTWQDHARRLTRCDSRYRQEAHRALRHRYLLLGPLAGGRHCRVWGAGPFGRRHAKQLREAGANVDDLIDIDPKKIGRAVAGGLRVAGVESVHGPDGRLILLCVGTPGARELIRAELESRGYAVERDFLPLQ